MTTDAQKQKKKATRFDEFEFRPAVKADKAGVLSINAEIFNGIDYMEWQFNMLVDSPEYFPWLCVHKPSGQIVSFAFGFAAGGATLEISTAGGRTRKDYQNLGLQVILKECIFEQVTGGHISAVSASLSVFNQPHLLADEFALAAQKPQKSRIPLPIVLHHSCLAFEMTPSLRAQLRTTASGVDETATTIEEIASPAAFLADEPESSAAGIGLGRGDYMVLCREAVAACPNSLTRLGHWIRCALATRQRAGSRSESNPLTGLSFATRYTCGAGSNLVLNVYSRDEAATSEHVVGQLRRYLINTADVDGERKTIVSAFFPHGLCHNEVLSRIHLNRWLGGGRLPLSNLPNAFCALRVTRAELRDAAAAAGDGKAAARAFL